MKLHAFEARVATLVARAMLPLGVLGGATDAVDPGEKFASQLLHSPWWSSLAIRGALWLVWLRPLASWRPRTFVALDEAARVALLEELARSHLYAIREGVMLLKLTLCMALLGEPRVMAHLGAYDPERPARPDRLDPPDPNDLSSPRSLLMPRPLPGARS